MLIKCHRCSALYQPGEWWLVRLPADATDRVHWVRPLDPKHCPICREPPQLEPTPHYAGVM